MTLDQNLYFTCAEFAVGFRHSVTEMTATVEAAHSVDTALLTPTVLLYTRRYRTLVYICQQQKQIVEVESRILNGQNIYRQDNVPPNCFQNLTINQAIRGKDCGQIIHSWLASIS